MIVGNSSNHGISRGCEYCVKIKSIPDQAAPGPETPHPYKNNNQLTPQTNKQNKDKTKSKFKGVQLESAPPRGPMTPRHALNHRLSLSSLPIISPATLARLLRKFTLSCGAPLQRTLRGRYIHTHTRTYAQCLIIANVTLRGARGSLRLLFATLAVLGRKYIALVPRSQEALRGPGASAAEEAAEV